MPRVRTQDSLFDSFGGVGGGSDASVDGALAFCLGMVVVAVVVVVVVDERGGFSGSFVGNGNLKIASTRSNDRRYAMPIGTCCKNLGDVSARSGSPSKAHPLTLCFSPQQPRRLYFLSMTTRL